MDDLLRVYYDPNEIGSDGYPFAWHGKFPVDDRFPRYEIVDGNRYEEPGSIKDLIREQAGHRCERCGHPYEKGAGEWSQCDSDCRHGEPTRWFGPDDAWEGNGPEAIREAQWRILTVHHLNGVKHDCRWWNLAALCQRCHLTIQGKVYMERPYDREHRPWFKPHAAGFYAVKYLGIDLNRTTTMARLDELLALEQTQAPLFEHD